MRHKEVAMPPFGALEEEGNKVQHSVLQESVGLQVSPMKMLKVEARPSQRKMMILWMT